MPACAMNGNRIVWRGRERQRVCELCVAKEMCFEKFGGVGYSGYSTTEIGLAWILCSMLCPANTAKD